MPACMRLQGLARGGAPWPQNLVLRNPPVAPISGLKKRISLVIKDKKQSTSHARSEIDMEIAKRARLTASLKEQRLKRDAEIAAATPPGKPPKRAPKQKVA